MSKAFLNGLKWAIHIIIAILSITGGYQLFFSPNDQPELPRIEQQAPAGRFAVVQGTHEKAQAR